MSVIVPVFDGERFLGDALESIFAQDHRPIEVIVVDDGSTDRSSEIARSFDEVLLVRWDENRGPAAARNAGLERVTGEFVTFLDADDRMAPGRLAAQMAHLVSHPDTGCVLMHQELVLAPGMSVPGWLRPFDAPDDVVDATVMTAMVRNDVLERVGGFDTSYRLCEDLEWLFRLQEAGVGIEVLPITGVYRRIHRGNATHQVEAVRASFARVIRERLERSRRGTG